MSTSASSASRAGLPLSRYKVLDLTIARAGPVAVRMLADWGADVTRVEAPPAGAAERATQLNNRHNPDEQNLHRNKRSLCIDLKSPQGAEVLRKLIAQSDVVVENFRSVVKERLGLTYEQLKNINPRIILASISGYGQSGPYSERPGVDQIMQGMSGLMSITGEPGRGPMRAGIAISDTTAGMFLGQGILLALLHREQTGEGQWVHTSLLEGMLNKLDFQGARYTVSGEVPKQEGNMHPTQVPMGTFRASDGLVNIAASSSRMLAGFCKALGAEQLLVNPAYRDPASRLANRVQLERDINAVTERFTTAQLVEQLNAAGAPCGPIYNIGQAFEDAQVRHLKMTRAAPHPTLGDIDLVRSAINLSACAQPNRFERAGPDPGEHNEELLRELGFDSAQIEQMKSEGVVA